MLLPILGALIAFQDPEYSAPNPPYRVAANIFYVGTKGIGAYLITTSKGHILIDGATEQGAGVIEDNIRTLGFKLRDVKVLLQTHAHYDHIGGLAKLKADTGARFYAMRGDVWGLEHGQHDSDTDYPTGRFPAIKVDQILDDGSTVTLGGQTMTAIHTPGHTKGCTSWTMTVRDSKIEQGRPLKVLFFGSATVAGNILVGNRAYPKIASDFRKTFSKLKQIKPDIFLANHPSFAEMDTKRAKLDAGHDDAFVDRESFAPFVEELRQNFEAEFAKQSRQ